jgi:hypothetical protein
LEIWEIFESNAFSCICDILVKFSSISIQIPWWDESLLFVKITTKHNHMFDL